MDCQLSHCLALVLLYSTGQSPMTFFFDNMWMSNTMLSTDFTIIHPLYVNTNNCRLQTTHESKWTHKQFWKCLFQAFEPLHSSFYQSSLNLQPFPSHTKANDGSSDFPAPFKYQFHLIMYLPHHPGEFIAKCWGGHNVLALECWCIQAHYIKF